jgi:AGCS family alanine or glycine:cation symporter
MQESFQISRSSSGLVMTALVALVILGGVRWIAVTCEALVPFMAIFYVGGCLFILVMNASHVLPAIQLICSSAFTPQAAGGGFTGASIMIAARYGIARGLFSNESGLGSAPIIAAAARTRNPVRQALVSSTGTFWDTVIVCAITGIVIVSSVLRDPALFQNMRGDALTRAAFAQIPYVGPTVLVVGLVTFVFSTILGWSYYGERAMEYLCGKKAIRPYRVAWVIAVYVGSVMTLPLVWDLADAMNALMAIPNLVALILLSKVVVAETQKYLWSGRLDEKGN